MSSTLHVPVHLQNNSQECGKRASAFNLPVVHGSEVIKMLPGWHLQGAYVLMMSHVLGGAMP